MPRHLVFADEGIFACPLKRSLGSRPPGADRPGWRYRRNVGMGEDPMKQVKLTTARQECFLKALADKDGWRDTDVWQQRLSLAFYVLTE